MLQLGPELPESELRLAALVAANPNFGAEVNLINNDIKTPYSDQFSIGMRNAFTLLGISIGTQSVTFAHIRSHDGISFSLGNRYPDGELSQPCESRRDLGRAALGLSRFLASAR